MRELHILLSAVRSATEVLYNTESRSQQEYIPCQIGWLSNLVTNIDLLSLTVKLGTWQKHRATQSSKDFK